MRSIVLAARVATVTFALASLGWAWFVAPILWYQAPMSQIARKIISGEQYRAGFLADFAGQAQANLRQDICEPVARRTLAIVRLRFAEEAVVEGASSRIRQTEADLDAALQSTLNCAPSDPLTWFALFWLQNNTRGLQQDNFKALRLSYRYGPNEGWLALRRSRFALAVYPALPDDLKRQAIDEFVQLVRSNFIPDAAEIVLGPGRPVSALLLSRLEGIDIVKLRYLARLLQSRDFDAKIPGVDLARPWER